MGGCYSRGKKEDHEVTYAMIKPDAQAKAEEIKAKVKELGGFEIVKERVETLSKADAEEFYAEHKERPFFAALVTFMTSGPITALLLRKKDAVKAWRAFIGPTNSAEAKAKMDAAKTDEEKKAAWTVRGAFGTDNQKNAVHGSANIADANREIKLRFKDFTELNEEAPKAAEKKEEKKADAAPAKTDAAPAAATTTTAATTPAAKPADAPAAAATSPAPAATAPAADATRAASSSVSAAPVEPRAPSASVSAAPAASS